jgi:hypothetical protein
MGGGAHEAVGKLTTRLVAFENWSKAAVAQRP